MTVSMTMPILIVDDYNTTVRIVRNLLRRLGFSQIDEASDGRAALAKLRAKDYALVISEAHMSSMSGLELLRQVRAEERSCKTPFVMLAGDADEGAQVETCAGVSGYIVKPFTAEALGERIAPLMIKAA